MELNKGNYKIKIRDKVESEKVQEALFKKGCNWLSGNNEIKSYNIKAIYIGNGEMTQSSEIDSYFKESSSKEIFVKDILNGYKPKSPTHLVVWEEDADPCRFFQSEQEAKDFIKELSEKSDVIKDSIILVEIKSARKVQIQKSLRYAQHKI